MTESGGLIKLIGALDAPCPDPTTIDSIRMTLENLTAEKVPQDSLLIILAALDNDILFDELCLELASFLLMIVTHSYTTSLKYSESGRSVCAVRAAGVLKRLCQTGNPRELLLPLGSCFADRFTDQCDDHTALLTISQMVDVNDRHSKLRFFAFERLFPNFIDCLHDDHRST